MIFVSHMKGRGFNSHSVQFLYFLFLFVFLYFFDTFIKFGWVRCGALVVVGGSMRCASVRCISGSGKVRVSDYTGLGSCSTAVLLY